MSRWTWGSCIVFLSGLLQADTVVLKSDGIIEDCRILSDEGGTVMLRTPGGRMGVPKDLIRRIEKRKSTFDTYDEMRSRVREGDARGLFRLAQWCKDKAGLREEARDLLKKVIALEKDHVEARRLLGYIRSGGDWRLPHPLAVRLKIADKTEDNEKIQETLSAQLSILLSTREDMQLAQEVKGVEKLDCCELAASVEIGKSPVVKFFNMTIRGPTVYAMVKLSCKAQWAGKDLPKLQLQGEVPASVTDARNQVLGDAFIRNAKDIHDFFDKVVQERLRQLESEVSEKNPPEKSLSQ